jgi:hypothetical protein
MGSRRPAARASEARTEPGQQQQPRPAGPDVLIEYSGASRIVVRSGRGLLVFSPTRRSRTVSARDAARLLRSPLFALGD